MGPCTEAAQTYQKEAKPIHHLMLRTCCEMIIPSDDGMERANIKVSGGIAGAAVKATPFISEDYFHFSHRPHLMQTVHAALSLYES